MCGHVGCCDSSTNAHATRHVRDTGQPATACRPARRGLAPELHRQPADGTTYQNQCLRSRRERGGSSTSRSMIAVRNDSGFWRVARICRAVNGTACGGCDVWSRPAGGRTRRVVLSSAVGSEAESTWTTRTTSRRWGRSPSGEPTRPASCSEFGRMGGAPPDCSSSDLTRSCKRRMVL